MLKVSDFEIQNNFDVIDDDFTSSRINHCSGMSALQEELNKHLAYLHKNLVAF